MVVVRLWLAVTNLERSTEMSRKKSSRGAAELLVKAE
jgi:hypothetical protein